MTLFLNELSYFAHEFINNSTFHFNNNISNAMFNFYEKNRMETDNTFSDLDKKISSLHLVLTGKAGKTNGIIFMGPPSTGKSLFMKILASGYKKIGNFNILNFKSEFALDDLEGADIAIGDEIIFENNIYNGHLL